MNTSKFNKSRYEKRHFDGKTTSTKTITYEQVMEINPQSVDHFQSSAFGIYAYRTAEGEWIEHRDGNCPGLGDVCLRIIQALQLNPAEFLRPTETPELRARNT